MAIAQAPAPKHISTSEALPKFETNWLHVIDTLTQVRLFVHYIP